MIAIAGGLLGLLLPGQNPTYTTAVTAFADAFATEPAGFLMAIPGVDDDFELFADGQLEFRGDGTAHLSAFLRRAASFDREFFVVLEFSGRLDPQSPGYPPAGSPVLTLLPNAYVPTGPVDPGAFVYFTQVTGTFTGIHSFEGASITAQAVSPAQLGIGASNKNIADGLAVDLALQVVTPPLLLPFSPTGPAQLRATLRPSLPHCATHVDADSQVSSGPARACATIPGLASDYVFLPVGTWLENPDGTASLQGLLRRQNDFHDQWQCDLQLGGRIDPGAPNHPPAGSPVLQLDAAQYAAQGGPIDPAQWRYYTQVTGTLTGADLNAGGRIDLAASGALQVGLAAGQGNLWFGAMGTFVPTVAAQPTGHTIAISGDIVLQCNLGTECILPPPQVLTGQVQDLPSVTELPAVFTGIDLGWCEQAAIGNSIIASTDPRQWYLGNLQVRDNQTVELFVPQAMPAGAYPVRLLHRAGSTDQLTINLQAPTTPTLRTESAIATGEDQHWVMHQGSLQGPVYSYLVLSGSNLPSILPGQISLQIGNQFQEMLLFPGQLHDFTTGLLTVTIPAMPPVFLGQRIYFQTAMIELASANVLPLPTTNVWFTDY